MYPEIQSHGYFNMYCIMLSLLILFTHLGLSNIPTSVIGLFQRLILILLCLPTAVFLFNRMAGCGI